MGKLPSENGTSTQFRPAPEIFGDATFELDAIRERIQWFARLTRAPGRFRLFDAQANLCLDEETGRLPDGLPLSDQPLTDVIDLTGADEQNWFRFVLRWTDSKAERLWAFANYHAIQPVGPAFEGIHEGVRRAVRTIVRDRVPDEVSTVNTHDCRSGLAGVTSLMVKSPVFESATRTRLGNPELRPFLDREIQAGLERHLRNHPDQADRVCAHVLAACRARRAARARRSPNP